MFGQEPVYPMRPCQRQIVNPLQLIYLVLKLEDLHPHPIFGPLPMFTTINLQC
jgi:hypothetical protein